METEQQRKDNSKKMLIGRYELISEIGNGGMGSVYIAYDRLLENKKIAVKILHPRLCDDLEVIKQFVHEVTVLQSLNHPNVIRIFDIGMENETYYYTMEYIEGYLLDEYSSHKEIDIFELCNLIVQICKGLEAIHEMGIVHRDLKPTNIMVTKLGEIKIADFGISSNVSTGETVQRDNSGTIDYLSPEICKGDRVTFSSDFYSLGIILYQLISGEYPFQTTDTISLYWKHVNEVPKSISTISDQIPIWLSDLVDRLLAKDPDKRPKSAREIIIYIRKNIFEGPELKDLNVAEKLEYLENQTYLYDSHIFEIKSSSNLPTLKNFLKSKRDKIIKFGLLALLVILLVATSAFAVIYYLGKICLRSFF